MRREQEKIPFAPNNFQSKIDFNQSYWLQIKVTWTRKMTQALAITIKEKLQQ
jgi:hypothetical protein